MATEIIGTANSDSLTFTGSLQQLTVTLVNAYSGEIIEIIEKELFVSASTYDGLGGNDALRMTPFSDYLPITNDVGMQVIRNIERISGFSGDEIINLSSNTITLGELFAGLGGGNDIFWGNSGNEGIVGGLGDDILDGGPGDDLVNGDDDNDRVGGGSGNDMVSGGNGDDIVYGGHGVFQHILDKQFSDFLIFPNLQEGVNIVNLVPPGTPNLGIVQGNLSIDFDTSVELTFREGFAGYNNTLGGYGVAEDGTIISTTAFWGNVKDAGIDTAHIIDLPLTGNGGDFGFFIIADGDRINNSYSGLDITGDGVLSFIYDLGGGGERSAKVTDDGNLISLVYDDGVSRVVLGGHIYHTTDRGGSPALNWDGQAHAISGLVSDGETNSLRIGFEDLPNLGDADFEDVLFDLNFTAVVVAGIENTGNDIVRGDAGNDLLYGEDGDDLLYGGTDTDIISGGTGSDQFYFRSVDGSIDIITDFEAGPGNDKFNLTEILTGYDEGIDDLNDFMQLVINGADTEVKINQSGNVGGTFETIALLQGVILTDSPDDLLANGGLILDQFVDLNF